MMMNFLSWGEPPERSLFENKERKNIYRSTSYEKSQVSRIPFDSRPIYISIFFFLLLLFAILSSHKLILFPTYELIIAAKSSRMAVFFIFIFIVSTILLGHTNKSSSAGDPDAVFFSHNPSLSYNENYHHYDGSDMEEEEEEEEYHGYDGYDEENDDDLDSEDVDSDDDEKDSDDLKRRTEEFIAKVTAKWREEFLSERVLYLTAS